MRVSIDNELAELLRTLAEMNESTVSQLAKGLIREALIRRLSDAARVRLSSTLGSNYLPRRFNTPSA